jgi:hypothetical protein
MQIMQIMQIMHRPKYVKYENYAWPRICMALICKNVHGQNMKNKYLSIIC